MVRSHNSCPSAETVRRIRDHMDSNVHTRHAPYLPPLVIREQRVLQLCEFDFERTELELVHITGHDSVRGL